METSDLTVVIVTLKSEEVIFTCLDSIPSNIKVIVVENSNNKKLKEQLEEKYQNTKCILAGENNGYAVGNNNFLTGATAGDVCITFPSKLRFGLGGASSTINFGTDGSATFGDVLVNTASGTDASITFNQSGIGAAQIGIPASQNALAFKMWTGAAYTERMRLDVSGNATFAGDIETTTAGDGVILKSPNGTRYRLTVANDGTLSTSAVSLIYCSIPFVIIFLKPMYFPLLNMDF